ncbi:hypothetical protein PG985_012629 [Apiospora marii]|uniref:uncharacterized protein n=1 Tax=Apiospora marii TaxID=335849 RepID=UPI00312F8A36
MGTTCRGMHETGFQEWGFLIFRCIYGDDEAWDRYMRYFKEAIHESLAKDSCEFLEKYSRWTIVQDEADLQAASKLRVRQRFRDWRDQNPVWREEEEVSRPVPRVVGEATLRLPRFTYCLHVDRDCLGTVDAHAAAKRVGTPYDFTPPLVTGLIDGDFVDLSPIDSYVCPPVEGCTQEYVGWEYIMVDFIPAFYNDCHYYNLESGMQYRRPPLIAPLNVGSMRMGVGKGGIIPSK